MQLPTADELELARTIIAPYVPTTPTFSWPLLNGHLGTTAYVKHENHTVVGAFKVRGGLVYMHALRARDRSYEGVIAATRGNHGQSIALAAGIYDVPCTIVVPIGNSREKNAAMRALGAMLIEFGHDFQAAREHAALLARERNLHFVPSFHRDLVLGVATYWMEFFEHVRLAAEAFPEVVFVPVGQGSGISACIAARALHGATTRIVGVVSAHATAYRDSFLAGRAVERSVDTVLADGLACRVPDAESLQLMQEHVDSVVAVTDDEVAGAMRQLFAATHNVAEGAGAASWAAAMQQRDALRGQRVGITLCGGNVDSDVLARVLAGTDASPAQPAHAV